MNTTFSPIESIKYGWNTVMGNKMFWIIVAALMMLVSGNSGYSSSSSTKSTSNISTNTNIQQNMYLNDVMESYQDELKMMEEEQGPTSIPDKVENVLGAMDEKVLNNYSNGFLGLLGLGVLGIIVLALPFIILMLLVQNALTMGFVKLGISTARGNKASFETIVSEMDLKKSARFILGAFLTAVTIILGLIVLIIPGFYFMTKYTFVTQLIIDKNMSVGEAFTQSAAMTSGHKLKLLGFMILLGILNLLGVLAFFYGLLITLPVTLIASGHAYKQLSK